MSAVNAEPGEAHGKDARRNRTMLLGTGFNSHQQVCGTPGDIHAFVPLIETKTDRLAEVLFAGWSSTVFTTGTSLFSLGHQILEPIVYDGVQRRCGFGDHDGMNGCLDDRGRLYTVQQPSQAKRATALSCRSTESSPRLGHVAQAQNGRTAVVFKQAPNGRLCHTVEFGSLQAFLSWFDDPSGSSSQPENHQMLPGRPKQLLANTATFVLLMEGGEVYTWGDGRYQSLGRPITDERPKSADTPTAVAALGGLKIDKVACGGWISAALSDNGALYIWGMEAPGSKSSIKCLRLEGQGAVAMVELPTSGSEPIDVIDVAIGDNHIVAVTEGQRLFAVGDNTNGQLGLGSEIDQFEEWTEVSAVSDAQHVFAGPRTTFVVTMP